MIYCQMKERTTVPSGRQVMLTDVADSLGRTVLPELAVPCPDKAGVWKLDALTMTRLLCAACPGEEVTMLGPGVCYIHRVRAERPDPWRPFRTVAAFGILLAGSALGLAWFHSDVDMPGAMLRVCGLITGGAPADPRWVTVPYAIGVALGVGVFYAVPFPKTATPLEAHLADYREEMEKLEGRDMDDD